jgi:protein dithiol:quinone oxidoreductase
VSSRTARAGVPSARAINFFGAVACCALLGYAYFTQYHNGLEPCPLCIFQRVTLAALGLAFLIAAIHSAKGWGRYVHAGLIGISALATVGLAIRHLYIQSLPPGSVPSCGAPLEVMLEFSPVFDVVRKVLQGGGECSEINWMFLGLTMPAWVLICALILGGLGVWANARRPR